MTKKRSPRPVAPGTRAKAKTQYHYISEFTDSQAEEIWKRDFRRICIGAAIVLALILLGVI